MTNSTGSMRLSRVQGRGLARRHPQGKGALRRVAARGQHEVAEVDVAGEDDAVVGRGDREVVHQGRQPALLRVATLHPGIGGTDVGLGPLHGSLRRQALGVAGPDRHLRGFEECLARLQLPPSSRRGPASPPPASRPVSVSRLTSLVPALHDRLRNSSRRPVPGRPARWLP